ncbi:MAG TPA: MFS transporter [Chthoniobacterales bacterium]|nr:MFS transporter [Chthoniobacterales bacterium]
MPCDEPLLRSTTPIVACSRSTGRWILAATILGSSMAFIDGTVVNVALPALQRALNADVVDVQWVIEAYALLLAAFLLAGGSLGDEFGRRRIFILGVALFALASAWCALAPAIGDLIAARAVQGLGAALLVPGSLAIISSSFAVEERGRAIGTWSGFSAITAAIGPVLGGWLIEHVSWRAVFFINVPLAALVIAISLWRVPESANEEKAPLDWLGAILGVLSLGALVYGLIESSRVGFTHISVGLSLAAGVVLLALFLVHEAKSAHPMLPLGLFRNRSFAGANLLTFLLYAALGGTLFFLPLNLIQVQHYTPTAAGAALLPFVLVMFLLSRWSGGLVEKYGARIPLVIGPLIAAGGFALFLRPAVGGTYWTTFFPAVVVLGIGMAVSVAPLTTTVMNSVPQSRVGVASGINNAVARTAGLLAIAVFGILMLQSFNHTLDERLSGAALTDAEHSALQSQRNKLAGAELPQEWNARSRDFVRQAIDESFVNGFRVVMAVGAMLAIGSAISGWLLIRPKPRAESRFSQAAG